MKAVYLFILLGSINFVYPCKIKPDQKIISFSSTVTSLLIELDLVKDPQLTGLMSEHIKFAEGFNGEVLYGGLVQSKKNLNKLIKSQAIFYDRSKRLKELLSTYGTKKIEVNTRGEGIFEYIPNTLAQLEPYLENCKANINSIQKKLGNLKKKLLIISKDQKSFPQKFIFFMGEIKDEMSLPDMIISGDLFLAELEKVIPHEDRKQHYSYTSEKLIRDKKNYCFIGLKDENDKNNVLIKMTKISDNRYNLFAKNIFLPGFDQFKILNQLINNLDYSCRLYKKRAAK